METTLRIRHLKFRFDGEALAPTAMALYQGLAELVSEHRAVRVIVEHGREDDRGVTRMVLTPPDVELLISGDSGSDIQPHAGIIESMKERFAEVGSVFIVNMYDVIDGLEDSDSTAS